jgi:hypothetical protein
MTRVNPAQVVRRLVPIAALWILAGTWAAGAATIVVPDDYESVTEACQVAVAGDTVAVMKGRYTEESVIVGAGVTVIGIADRPRHVVVWGDCANTFTVMDGPAGVLLRNISIQGAGLSCVRNYNPELVISECILEQGDMGYAYTRHLVQCYADVVIERCSLSHVAWDWPVIDIPQTCDVLVRDCRAGLCMGMGGEWSPIAAGSHIEFRNNTL